MLRTEIVTIRQNHEILTFHRQKLSRMMGLKSFAEINSRGTPVLTNFANWNFCEGLVFKILKFRRIEEMFLLLCCCFFVFVIHLIGLKITPITSITSSSTFIIPWKEMYFMFLASLKINFLIIFHFNFYFKECLQSREFRNFLCFLNIYI